MTAGEPDAQARAKWGRQPATVNQVISILSVVVVLAAAALGIVDSNRRADADRYFDTLKENHDRQLDDVERFYEARLADQATTADTIDGAVTELRQAMAADHRVINARLDRLFEVVVRRARVQVPAGGSVE